MGSNKTLFWRMVMTNQSYKRQNSHQLSLWRRTGGQSDENQNKQQQQQPANHGSDNAEIARCLTPFSHPVSNQEPKSDTVCKLDNIQSQEDQTYHHIRAIIFSTWSDINVFHFYSESR